MKKHFTAKIISLEEVYTLVFELAQMIMKTSISFDVVIAIARGGMLPGRLICDFLNIDRLSSMQIRHYQSGAEQMERAKIIDPVRLDLKNKKVLLIDDVNDSGTTLRVALDHIQSIRPDMVRSAVIHEKENNNFKADFVGVNLTEWKWLIYQWAATEDILEFLRKDNMLNKSKETAISHLARTYNLHINKNLFDSILRMKENYVEQPKKG